jgi:hypothetical protein
LIVVGGAAAVVVVMVLGRPRVTVLSSDQALVQVQSSGLWTKLSEVQATNAGRPVALVRDDDGLVPTVPLAQGQSVRVTATATPPSWLHWLLGSGVSATRVVDTPIASPSGTVALASHPGEVPVNFDNPVSLVHSRPSAGPSQVIRLSRPATVVDITVPAQAQGGSLEVAAAPRSWETVSSQSTTLTWFVAPASGIPTALADPAPGSTSAGSNAPVTLAFSEPVATVLGGTRPTISPAVAGAWSEPGPYTLVFTPSGFGFGPGAAVTVGFDRPVSVVGATSGMGATPASGAPAVATAADTASSQYQYSVGPGSILRLQQILAQLGYLPLNFVPAPGVALPTTLAAEVATMTQPLAGTFSWRWASTPDSLKAQWAEGSPTVMVKGALMAFDSARGTYNALRETAESVAQLTSTSMWQALLQAAATNQLDPAPYSYVSVSEARPETMSLWQNGSVLLTSRVNTGIPSRPTALGTYPVYLRYDVAYMDGTNPDGSKYHDLVHWINYFNGGDAVHGFVRGSYGFPQSLGCVEVPVPTAAKTYTDLAIGDLVTVAA